MSHFTLDISVDAVDQNSLLDADAITDANGDSLEYGNKDGITGAVKFDYGDSSGEYSFTSNRSPVWGHFYAKGGASNNGGASSGTQDHLAATNLGFGDETLGDFGQYIARPNSRGGVVPEPSSFLVFIGLGMCTVFGVWRQRRKSPGVVG